MSLRYELLQLLAETIAAAVAGGIISEVAKTVPLKVEYPRDPKFGDYAMPYALEAARHLRMPPMKIAEIIAGYLKADPRIGLVEVAHPGFINIVLSGSFLFENLLRVVRERSEYGRFVKPQPRRVNIEFVSANPTGPLNVVSARAAAVGDAIANLLEFMGDIVDREYYVNDYGNQIRLLGMSVLARMRERRGEPACMPEDGYHGEYIRDLAAAIDERFGEEIDRIVDEEERIHFAAQKAVEMNVAQQKKDLERFGVRFAHWFSERLLHERGEVAETLECLKESRAVYEEERRILFRSTAYGDDKDRVLVRDDGRPTYFLADIAYHRNKFARGYEMAIDIWGPDHYGHIARLLAAMEAMGYPPGILKILIAQQVNIMVAGETVKMSKRLGTFSTMRELMDEIGVDAARYFFTMRSLESHLDFDIELAKKESSENPVYYLQYAHARICSLFREAEKRGVAYQPSQAEPSLLDNEESTVIMKLIAKFPEEVADAAEKFEPHRIASFLMRLAQSFHKFYTEHRIITEDQMRSITYLTLCDAVRIVLASGLRILGVSAPERM